MSEAIERTNADLSRALHRTVWVFAITVVVLLFATGAAIATRTTHTTTETPIYAPLGDYPTQSITTEQPIPVGHDVGVTGTKCNVTANEVRVRGHVTWQQVNPGGASFARPEGVGVVLPGCTRKHFENLMPPEVVARVNQLAAQGTFLSTWVITGIETPIAPNGERPVTKAFRTDNFRILGGP